MSARAMAAGARHGRCPDPAGADGGILLDPVYSGKAMAGMIDHIRKGTFASNEDIVFLHTGGSTALSGYKQPFLKA